jgi:formylglycine-generating enzyme required for sulfatase activity
LAIARELSAASDMDGAKTLLQTAAEANPSLIPQINEVEVMRDRTGAVYSYVPGGEFLMGSDTQQDPSADNDETPQHSLDVAGFWIMRAEVTIAQYAKCVQAGVCSEPGYERWNDPAYAEHPVTYVTWLQANDYAKWVGGQLPTEAEWEKACRGTDGRIYPWSNETPTADLANFNSNVGDTTPVGSYPQGASPFGVLDMAGNVWEWTASKYAGYPYTANDGREDLAGDAARTLRGGSWFNAEFIVRCAARYGFDPDSRSVSYGFRVLSPGFRF